MVVPILLRYGTRRARRRQIPVRNGNHGTSDGNAKSIGVIDLTANPVRVINHVTVGDPPEGLAISPKGTIAVSVEARGSNQPTSSWFYHKGGAVSVLKIEGAVFSADGSHIYIGIFLDCQ